MKAKLKSLLRLLLLILALISAKESHAADIVVVNFKSLPTDQTAINCDTMKNDQNGDTATLIKTLIKAYMFYFDNGENSHTREQSESL